VLGEAARSTGRRLFELSLAGGRQAVGRPVGVLAPGHRADFVVIDGQGFEGDAVLDHWLFAADNAAIKSVHCGGVPVVQNGRHKDRERIAQRYGKARRRSGALP
jgi:cytosine/adenosine deaminase-related metal-dependent hydrolase